MDWTTPTESQSTTPANVRSWKETLVIAAAIAFGLFMLFYFPDRDDGSGATLGALCAFIPVALGLRAVEQVRPLPAASTAARTQLTVFSLALGLALGIANLSVNYGMAMLDRTIHEQMITRWAAFSAWSVVISEPIAEEIAYRLILLSGLAWIAGRFTTNRRTILAVALGISALLFGVAHIFYGGVDNRLYAVGMAAKSSGAGLLLGWVFWRCGLPYSMLCHCAANAIHLVLIPVVFQ